MFFEPGVQEHVYTPCFLSVGYKNKWIKRVRRILQSDTTHLDITLLFESETSRHYANQTKSRTQRVEHSLSHLHLYFPQLAPELQVKLVGISPVKFRMRDLRILGASFCKSFKRCHCRFDRLYMACALESFGAYAHTCLESGF